MALQTKINNKGWQTVSAGSPAAVADNAMSAESDAVDYDNSTEGYPQARVRLDTTYAVAPLSDAVIVVYMQVRDIDGTTGHHTPQPDATYKPKPVGYIYPDAVTVAQYPATPAPIMIPKAKVRFYLENLSGQSLPAGWLLAIDPMGHGS